MRAISLFSGAGGMDLGLERAGIQTVLQAEQDPWCLQVLERHWPDVERVTDVRSVGVHQQTVNGRRPERGLDPVLTGATGRRERGEQSTAIGVDLVYGGFPCQDVSVAGNRAGLGGARSGLWSEFHRVLRELRPRWCLVENVPGLLSSNRGHDFGTILRGLDELGYGVAWRILDARHFGVPQRRRRVFLVGCLGNPIRAAQVLAVCAGCSGHSQARSKAGQDIAADLDGCVAGTLGGHHGNVRADQAWTGQLVANGLRASDGHHGHSSPRGDGSDNLIAFSSKDYGGDAQLNGSPTLKVGGAGEGGGNPPAISSAAGVRRLTPLECERLMGWPDDFTRWAADGREIPDSHRYRLCGNGVVSTVAEWIGHRLVAVDRMLDA